MLARATRQGLPHQFTSRLSQLAVHDLVDRIVNETNKRFARCEHSAAIASLNKELDHGRRRLTARKKVRRAIIEKKFARETRPIIYQAEGDASI